MATITLFPLWVYHIASRRVIYMKFGLLFDFRYYQDNATQVHLLKLYISHLYVSMFSANEVTVY